MRIDRIRRIFTGLVENDYKLKLIEHMDLPIITISGNLDGDMTIQASDGYYGSEYINQSLIESLSTNGARLEKGQYIKCFLNWNGLHGTIHYDRNPYSLVIIESNVEPHQIEKLTETTLGEVREHTSDYDYKRGCFQAEEQEGTLKLVEPTVHEVDFSQHVDFIWEVISFCDEYMAGEGTYHREAMIYEDLPFHTRMRDIISSTGIFDGASEHVSHFSAKLDAKINSIAGLRPKNGVNDIIFNNPSFVKISTIINSLGESIDGDPRKIISREFSLTNSTKETLADRVVSELIYGLKGIEKEIPIKDLLNAIEMVDGLIYTTLAVYGAKIDYLNKNIHHPLSRFHINSVARRIDRLYAIIDEFVSVLVEDEREHIPMTELNEIITLVEEERRNYFH